MDKGIYYFNICPVPFFTSSNKDHQFVTIAYKLPFQEEMYVNFSILNEHYSIVISILETRSVHLFNKQYH